MNGLLESLGRSLRRLRAERGRSLRDLATESGLSERVLRELEGGRANISVARLAPLAAALGRTAGELLCEAEAGGAEAEPRSVIALLGLRGAGKTAVGARLAARLKVPFFELDQLIEKAAGLSLREIFALHGESYYRRLELESLRAFLGRATSAVLATGGGIVANEEAYRLLRDRAVTVWLKADPRDHWQRVVRQGDSRPMADNPRARSELRRILAEREPRYREARHHVDTSRLGFRRSVDSLLTMLREAPAAPRPGSAS